MKSANQPHEVKHERRRRQTRTADGAQRQSGGIKGMSRNQFEREKRKMDEGREGEREGGNERARHG